MTTLKFGELSKSEFKTVDVIVQRALAMNEQIGELDLIMTLSAVHAHTPLRLDELSTTDDGNFIHDVFGMLRFIDRKTGRLTCHFSPRFARRKVV